MIRETLAAAMMAVLAMAAPVGAPALAQASPSLNGPPTPLAPPDMMKSTVALKPAAAKVARLEAMRLGGFTVNFEQTKLQDAARSANAVVGKRGEAGKSLSWICATLEPDARLWLYSSEMAGGAISGATLSRETGLMAGRRCPSLPAAMQPLGSLSGLSLGDPRLHATQLLGPAPPGEWASYRTCMPISIKDKPFDQCVETRIRFDADRIVMIDAFQVSTPSAEPPPQPPTATPAAPAPSTPGASPPT